MQSNGRQKIQLYAKRNLKLCLVHKRNIKQKRENYIYYLGEENREEEGDIVLLLTPSTFDIHNYK